MQDPLTAGLSLVRRTFGLPAQNIQVKQNTQTLNPEENSPTHRCGARVRLPLGLVGGTGNRPMALCRGPSLELAESGMETSSMPHVCGGTRHQRLRVKERPFKEAVQQQ